MDTNAEPHPLHIDPILDILLNFVSDLKDLVNCRQVCRKWNYRFTPLLKKELEKYPLTLKSLWSPPKYLVSTNPLLYEEFSSGSTDSSFDRITKDLKPIPMDSSLDRLSRHSSHMLKVSSLHAYIAYLETQPSVVRSNIYIQVIPIADDLAQKFFQKHGHIVKHLKLKCHANGPDSVEHIHTSLERLIFHQCRNTETLSLDISGMDFAVDNLQSDGDSGTNIKTVKLHLDHDIANSWVVSLMGRIFKASPMLKNISMIIDLCDYLPPETWTGSLLQLPKTSSIEAIQLKNVFPEDIRILKLCARQLKLKEFRCDKLSLQSSLDFHLLMEVVKDTLEILVIDCLFGSVSDPPIIQFPAMPKLKLLRIGIVDTHILPTVKFACVNFPQKFPSLLGFAVPGLNSKWECNVLKPLFEQSNPHLKLRWLHLPTISNQIMDHFARVFPNIKGLRIGCPGEQPTNNLWDMWPGLNLADFKLTSPISYTTETIDWIEILTGFSKEECETLCSTENIYDSGSRIGESHADLRELVMRPNNCRGLEESMFRQNGEFEDIFNVDI